MNITLTRLGPDSPDIPKLRALNEEAFPPEERIPIEYLMDGLADMGQDMLGIYDGGAFIGFFAMALYGRCAYISYFAIVPERRSQGRGGAALKALNAYYADRQIVVDFEAPDAAAPNNAVRLRRRDFYLRNGYYSTGYYQFYMDTEFEIACNQPEYDRAAYEALVAMIHAQVPDFNPHHYRKDA